MLASKYNYIFIWKPMYDVHYTQISIDYHEEFNALFIALYYYKIEKT